MDNAGGAESHKNANCQSLLNNILADWGFCDVFGINFPDARVYTHFYKQHKTHSRLEFFLDDDRLVNLPVFSSNISHGFCSDHSYVTLTLQGNPLGGGGGGGVRPIILGKGFRARSWRGRPGHVPTF